MLGESFYKLFKQDYKLKCSDIDLNEDWLSFLDFRDYRSYRECVINYNPDYLFHLGAYTDLEYCEYNPEDTYLTNTKSVEHAVSIANELDIPLLYVSTAGIFNGKKDLYNDRDEPDPIGHYAKSKYLGERYVQEHSDKYLICRAGWMMGGGPNKDKKFIQKLMQQIKDGTDELFIVNDKLGTPTYTHDFARNVKLLIENRQRGLFNMVCEGFTSRLEVAKELLALTYMEDKITITEVSSDHFSEEYFAERPDSECLVNKRLNELGLNLMRDWKIALEEYISLYYADYLSWSNVSSKGLDK